MKIKQGQVYWAALGEDGEEIIHPQVVIQDDILNGSRINTVVVCALSTNMRKAKDPGNILLEPGEANLTKRSIVVVSQVSTVDKKQLGEYIGKLSDARVAQILAGMKFLQTMMDARDLGDEE